MDHSRVAGGLVGWTTPLSKYVHYNTLFHDNETNNNSPFTKENKSLKCPQYLWPCYQKSPLVNCICSGWGFQVYSFHDLIMEFAALGLQEKCVGSSVFLCGTQHSQARDGAGIKVISVYLSSSISKFQFQIRTSFKHLKHFQRDKKITVTV